MQNRLNTALVAICAAGMVPAGPAEAGPYVKKATWAETVAASQAAAGVDVKRHWQSLRRDFPIQCDWAMQDVKGDPAGLLGDGDGALVKTMIARVLAEIGNPAALSGRLKSVGGDGRAGLDLYVKACEQRRAKRLKIVLAKSPRIVFTKHYTLGGSHYAYTEGQSDAQAERHFRPGGGLFLLEMTGLYGKVRTLVNAGQGVIRDPDVSYDGKRILFACKKSDRQDDYHLYEMNAATGKIRQLTFGLGYADYEACYLPNDDILFNSSRCVQTVDCWWTEVSNLYTCNKDGKYMRRLSFDQVHTNYPTVMRDGRVIYTRWDYNDRGQIYPQPLFQMNFDGTGQTEMYGNNSWFPTTIAHARGLPGSERILAILTGHHSHQKGKLAIIDPNKGRQEAQGVQLIAPIRETRAVRVDSYGQGGDQWQYPYPLSDREYLVTYCPLGGSNRRYPAPFAIYYQDIDGRRELLASDPNQPCSQPVPLAARKKPALRPSAVDYRKKTGTYYVQDVYHGPGLKGIARGTVKQLRVVALEFRSSGIGSNNNGGPAGGAVVSTPVAVRNGTWDVKHVLGQTTVHTDGSAMFVVPARRPLYFQLLDAKGCVVQSMRSWSTLMPGERFSCTGCHEDKNEAPPAGRTTLAMRAGAKPLEPFYGPPRGFSFIKEIQPIFDKHCIKCHNDRTKTGATGKAAAKPRPKSSPATMAEPAEPPKPPKGAAVVSGLNAAWKYTTKRPPLKWVAGSFDDSAWTPGTGGFGTAGTPGGKICTPWRTNEIWLRRKIDIPAAAAKRKMGLWLSHDEDVEIYINGKLAGRRGGHTGQFFWLPMEARAQAAIKGGQNTLAVHCRQTGGGQFIDVALYAVGTEPVIVKKSDPVKPVKPAKPVEVKKAFSLLGTTRDDGRARRKWSDSYLALTQNGRPNKLVNWLNAQSIPPMLPPYFTGSAKSQLMPHLEKGHNKVKLSREEMEKIACWIDLLVPYCGSYDEAAAWSDRDRAKYKRYMDKRTAMEEMDRRNIRAFIAAGQP